jgi:uncharacterized protein YkwD
VALRRSARLALLLAFAAVVVVCVDGSCAFGASPRHRRHRPTAHHQATHRRHAPGRRVRRRARRRRACANTGLTPSWQDLQLIRAATLCLINRERVTRGEAPLRPNAHLRHAAQGHSDSMSVDDYFEHYGGGGPGGGSPLSRMRAAGYISSSRVGFEIGENIAWGTRAMSTPRAIVAAWMASPPHRANILDSSYRETGIGVSPKPPAAFAEGQPGAIYTQDFGVIIGL